MSLLFLFTPSQAVDVTGSATLIGVGVVSASGAVAQTGSAGLIGVGVLTAEGTVSAPVEDGGAGAGRRILIARGAGIVPAAEGQGTGRLVLRGRGRGLVAPIVGRGHGALLIRGHGAGVPHRARMAGQGYAAAPGEWVVVIEGEAAEGLEVVVSR